VIARRRRQTALNEGFPAYLNKTEKPFAKAANFTQINDEGSIKQRGTIYSSVRARLRFLNINAPDFRYCYSRGRQHRCHLWTRKFEPAGRTYPLVQGTRFVVDHMAADVNLGQAKIGHAAQL